MPVAYAVEWVESERGWGVRPDGYTLSLTREDAEKHTDKVVRDMRLREAKSGGGVPDCYSRPATPPFEVEISAADLETLTQAAKEGTLGLWGRGNGVETARSGKRVGKLERKG